MAVKRYNGSSWDVVAGVGAQGPAGANGSDGSAPLTTKGDLLTRSSTAVTRLGVGTNGQVLTADSAEATGLKWAAAAAGGMTLIETLSPSGVASVTTASIAGTYKHLLLVVKGVYASTNTDFYLRMNGDSGNNYTYSRVNITATPAFTGTVTSATSEIRFSDIANVTGYNQVVSGYFWIYRYPDTDHTFGNGGFIAEDGVRKATYINGLYNNSAAITTLTLGVLSGTMTDGDIWVYGVN